MLGSACIMQAMDIEYSPTGVRWCDIPNFPEYKADLEGGIWSRRFGAGKKWRLLRRHSDRRGYPYVTLYSGPKRNRKVRCCCVSRLVLLAFRGEDVERRECCHFPDRNPANCQLDNLRWGTRSENMADRVIHGTVPRSQNHPRARYTDGQIRAIRKFAQEQPSVNFKDLGKPYGMRSSYIGRILRREIWTYLED